AERGDEGFATDRDLADRDARGRAGRQIDAEARAEADEAETFAYRQRGPRLDPADDPACNETGDLHDRDRTVGTLDHQAVALVFFARLVELGIEELARTVVDAGDAAARRRALAAPGEDAHGHRDPRAHRAG